MMSPKDKAMSQIKSLVTEDYLKFIDVEQAVDVALVEQAKQIFKEINDLDERTYKEAMERKVIGYKSILVGTMAFFEGLDQLKEKWCGK